MSGTFVIGCTFYLLLSLLYRRTIYVILDSVPSDAAYICVDIDST